MITPRRTRLIRVPDLRTFRAVIARWCGVLSDGADRCAVVVPTRGAAVELRRALSASGPVPALPTRDQLYDVLHARLAPAPRRLTMFERDAMAQAAADEAARAVGVLPFQIRPGLVAEMLRFYDHLRRQSQQVDRFEALITEALGADGGLDRGTERLLQQTQFLAGTFRAYERRVLDSQACDEHRLRERLIAEAAPRGLRHVMVTVADWIADPTGLFVADFDLLARVSGLETLDIVCTEGVLRSGFDERLHDWLPGLEAEHADALRGFETPVRPRLVCPVSDDPNRLWFTYRDREDELTAVASRLSEGSPDRAAVVFKRPLPYLYLAPDTLGAAGIAFQMTDALPLAAEPLVATIDLILDAVETRFARESLVALLGSPYLHFVDEQGPVTRQSIGEMNREMSDRRYLGGFDRLETLAGASTEGGAGQALGTALDVSRELVVLVDAAPASRQLGALSAFLERHWRPLDPLEKTGSAQDERELNVRAAVMQILSDLASAHAAHHDPPWTIDDLAAAVRRWIGNETFPVSSAITGVHLVDDQTARYGEFDDVTIVGLIENEWPDRPRRNIFYPPGLLKALGWPPEKDRRAAADARFVDLLASSADRVELSTFSLEDEALVTRSMQLDEVPRAGLSRIAREPAAKTSQAGDSPLVWAALRRDRSPADAPEFHGSAGLRSVRSWSVSALETYLACPFKFFAQHVVKLDEEPDDEEVMDPRRQGQFVHEVFETFFREWQSAGHRGITAANLETARTVFVAVVDRALDRLPEGEAALERTRLLGSSAAAGLGEAAFRMEAERPVAVLERLLEHSLSGTFAMSTDSGPREVQLRGKADRVDLLADGTFRVIDYKLGWPPDRGRALQLPIYGICAEQRLEGHRGRRWMLGEAVYLAFKGPKRVVPLFPSIAAKDEVLRKAQQRLAETLDAVERGDFPPKPDDVYRCETCSFRSVCRTDYVGDV